jgi:cyclophilin family peptidyl-prolyl cis-trans isomerase
MKKTILLVATLVLLTGCGAGISENNSIDNSLDDNTEGEIENNIENNNTDNKKDMSEDKLYTQAIIKTSLGDITVDFYNADSPLTVKNFTKLSAEGFYDGTKFHRIINDFMIQGGDPLTKEDSKMAMWGTGGPGYKFDDEFNTHKLVRGSLAMANSGPNTNGSQFFIVTASDTPWLDGKHTNFGQVSAGMDIVEKIEAVPTEGSDRPVEAITILGIELK